MKPICVCSRFFAQRLSVRRGAAFLALIFLLAVNLLSVATTPAAYSRPLSLADALILSGSGPSLFFGFSLPLLLLLSALFSRDFTLPFLLRTDSRRVLWSLQGFAAACVAAVLAPLHVAETCAIASGFACAPINFGDPHSLFVARAYGHTLPALPFSSVLAYSLLFEFLVALVFGLIFLLFLWLFEGKAFVPLILCMAFSFTDMLRIFGISTWFGLEHPHWLSERAPGVAILLLIALALFFSGWYLSPRREFLHAK